jgi:uncharacterized protein (TIGR02996 family)
MADRASFLAAIRADTEDDAPRLVFADWLEENGDPVRAEFIRVQSELARLTELTVGSRAMDDDALRVLASGSATRLKRLSFQDGSLGAAGMTALAASPVLARLLRLNLRGNRLNEAGCRALAASPQLRRGLVLNLRQNSYLFPEVRKLLTERFGDGVAC